MMTMTITGSGLAAAPVLAAEPPQPFDAQFEVLRNGKLIGEAHFALTVDGGRWEMRSDMEGTRGVANFLGVKENSLSRGTWTEGQPRPEAFEQEVKVSFRNILTSADFDWAAGEVRSVHKDGENTLPLSQGILDPVSVGLAVRAGLGAGEDEWRLPMVDEDEIEEQHFRLAETGTLNTALGCLETHRVDKIRGPQSTRYTHTWYADDLAFVPVYIAHGKTDGDRMESRIVSLTIDGQEVLPVTTCD